MALNEIFTKVQLDAARAMILPIADDPARGEVLLCATAMLIASVAIEGADPLRDAMTMAEELLGNAIAFIAAVNEARQDGVRFDA